VYEVALLMSDHVVFSPQVARSVVMSLLISKMWHHWQHSDRPSHDAVYLSACRGTADAYKCCISPWNEVIAAIQVRVTPAL
jgi:hypothetical protein